MAYSTTINEGGSITAVLSFTDGGGTAVAPTSLSYTVTDDASGAVVVGSTALSPASTVSVTIPGTRNLLINQDNSEETRTLTATAIYLGTTATAQYSWRILNLARMGMISAPYASWNAVESMVLDLIGEDPETPDAFTLTPAGQAPLRDSVNAAIQELAAQTGSYVRPFQILTLAGRQFYRVRSVGDHFGYCLELWNRTTHWRLTQASIQRIARQDPRCMQTEGTPWAYCHVGQDTIGLYPIPATSGTVIEGRAVMIPRAVTDGTDPLRLRETYHTAAALYACSEFYASRGDAGRATEYLKEYLDVAKLKREQPRQGLSDRGGADGDVRG